MSLAKSPILSGFFATQTAIFLCTKTQKSLLARDDELDGLFERIYEDNVSGKLSDDRFAKMSRRDVYKRQP